MNNFESLYDLLEVPKTATKDEIKKAFHLLAGQYHPDKNHNSTERVKRMAEEKFKEINEAYSILNDSSKRKQYDEKLREFELKRQQSQTQQSHNAPPRPKQAPYQAPKTGLKITRKQIIWTCAIVFFLLLVSSGDNSSNNRSSSNDSFVPVVHKTVDAEIPKDTSSSDTEVVKPKTDSELCKESKGAFATYDNSSETCVCMDGYALNSNNKCTSHDYLCSEKNNGSVWDGTTCSCPSGTVWNSSRTACVTQSASYLDTCQNTYGLTSYYTGQNDSSGKIICDCRNGSSWNNTKTACISDAEYDQSCQSKFGPNTYYTGQKSTEGNNLCSCKSGYYWNSAQTACFSQVEYNQQCENSYGPGSSYSTYSDRCSCDYGYTWSSVSNWCVKNQ